MSENKKPVYTFGNAFTPHRFTNIKIAKTKEDEERFKAAGGLLRELNDGEYWRLSVAGGSSVFGDVLDSFVDRGGQL